MRGLVKARSDFSSTAMQPVSWHQRLHHQRVPHNENVDAKKLELNANASDARQEHVGEHASKAHADVHGCGVLLA